jgi:hypothetical protein
VLLGGAWNRGEDGANVCLYAIAYLYQTCREYVQQIRRAMIGGQMSYGNADNSAILHLWAMRASLLCNGCGLHAAVCRRRVWPTTPPAPQPCRYSPIPLVGYNLARCVYPLQVQDQGSDYTSSQRRRLDVAAAMVVRPSCGTDAMACLPVSSRVDSAVPRQPRRPTATAPHRGKATALVRSSSVLRRSKCERENKARYGQACIGR